MAIFLGIDGGGTKTSCLLGDETSILGSGTAGPSNIVRVGEVCAKGSLTAAIRQACTVGGVNPAQVEKTCLGIAGAAQREISDAVRRMISEVVSGEVDVLGDMEIALEAAFGSGPGAIVIAGTGSIAYARNAEGRTARAGGWGFAVSDEGSGHWIGQIAVSTVLRVYDESQQESEPALLKEFLEAWHIENLQQLVLKVNGIPTPDFAALLPLVVAAAESGDLLARNVLARAGAELATLGKIVMRRLFPRGRVPVGMSGGVFSHSAVVRQIFYNSLRSEYPDAVLNPTVVDPVRGALELARKAGVGNP